MKIFYQRQHSYWHSPLARPAGDCGEYLLMTASRPGPVRAIIVWGIRKIAFYSDLALGSVRNNTCDQWHSENFKG